MPLRLDLEGAVAVIRYIESSPLLAGNRLVGSGTGAVIRRPLLGCVRGFPLRARVGVAVIPFPVPAASHAACGFAALRAPAPLRGKGYGAVRVGSGGRTQSVGHAVLREETERP